MPYDTSCSMSEPSMADSRMRREREIEHLDRSPHDIVAPALQRRKAFGGRADPIPAARLVIPASGVSFNHSFVSVPSALTSTSCFLPAVVV